VRRLALLTGLLAASLPLLVANAAAAAPLRTTTGNVLVLLDRGRFSAAGRSAVHAAMERTGAKPAGKSVPEIGLVTLRPPSGVSPAAFMRRLRALPGVRSVQAERRYVPRMTPNDPALTASDPSLGGAPWQWYLGREDFFRAWDIAQGKQALVGVIDSGIDGGHPDLSSKIVAAVDQQQPGDSTGPANTDQAGHGTHVASLACADTNNGIGMAGAGFDCGLLVEKTDFTDSSIAAAIVDATNRHADALNMSFGPPGTGSGPAPDSEVRALDYAAAHNVVLVAAAADSPDTEQGDPANVLQPAGSGANISSGIGLDVTAADYGGARASFAGYGSEVSLAAFGAFKPDSTGSAPCSGPPAGVFGAFPAGSAQLEAQPNPSACRVTLGGDSRYATIAGTSMAAPQVAGVAAMMRVLNPYASLQDILRILKYTAGRPPGAGWSSDLGWGILDAGAALDATRHLDRQPPVSQLSVPRVTRRRTFRLRWQGHDPQASGLIASGIAYFQVFVSADGERARLLASTSRHTLEFRGRPGHKYVFFAIAVDRAGNRESRAPRVATRVARDAR
jgi:serine protease